MTSSRGKSARAVFAQDRETGIKLLAPRAWFVRAANGELNAFLLKSSAEKWSKANSGQMVDYTGARDALTASR